MAISMIGRKVGMMRLYDGAGRVRAVTAIELGPNVVTQLRSPERDGYSAAQVGYRGDRKRLTRPARGHLRAAGIDEPLSVLREFRTDGGPEFSVGQELRVDQFTPGEFVDVTGVSKGRGFAGGVKRWGFHGGPKTHGQSDTHRGPGSVGAGTTPGKVWKGQKMAGHMGTDRKTVRNLLVVLTDLSRNLIFVEGSVPGASKGVVTVSTGRRPALAEFEPPPPFPAVEPEETAAETPRPAPAENEVQTADAQRAEPEVEATEAPADGEDAGETGQEAEADADAGDAADGDEAAPA